jgi:biotin carboxylase
VSAAGKALIVLGAGEEQVSIYHEARRRGLSTVAVDLRDDRPAIPLADEFLKISTTDHAAIATALAGREIAGVVSVAADTCLESWHRLSVRYGTPWRYPAAAAAVSMDKSQFHRVAASVGMPGYRWVQTDDLAELYVAARGFHFPVVVKPADASGGRGVQSVSTVEQLRAAMSHAADRSPSGQVIVEEFLSGRNLTVNVFMVRGEIATSAITEKQILPGRNFLIGGHIAPARLDEPAEQALLDDARKLCVAFELTDGPANFDVIVTEDGTRFVLEVGARMCGNGFPQLVHALTGVDWVAALVDLAVGVPVRIESTRWRPSQLHVLASPVEVASELVATDGFAEVAAMDSVVAIDMFARPGDVIKPFTEAGRKVGWIVVSADDHDLLAMEVGRAVRTLRIMVKPLVNGRVRSLVTGTDPGQSGTR